jgi:hypothetical protein
MQQATKRARVTDICRRARTTQRTVWDGATIRTVRTDGVHQVADADGLRDHGLSFRQNTKIFGRDQWQCHSLYDNLTNSVLRFVKIASCAMLPSYTSYLATSEDTGLGEYMSSMRGVSVTP